MVDVQILTIALSALVGWSGEELPTPARPAAIAPTSQLRQSLHRAAEIRATDQHEVEFVDIEENSTQAPATERPSLLRRPIEDQLVAPPPPAAAIENDGTLLQTVMDPPLGYTGPSGIIPTEAQENSHFVPVHDRWRLGFPAWDRYGKGNPIVDDYPYEEGHWWDPYNQNVLKGDYPIIGEHTFLNVTLDSLNILEARQVPIATTPFESTARPFEEDFFGRPNQLFFTTFNRIQFDLFHGDTAAFKPLDWMIRVAPVVNANYLDVEELGVVNSDVRKGTTRTRNFTAMEEWWLETKLFDSSPHYDFVSARIGSQPFVSDFRGFIFADINRGARIFGTRNAGREEFNFIFFDQTEKDTNSQLNSYDDRRQNTFIANWYRQDTIWSGYTAQASFHYNRDLARFKFDKNNFLVRPDPVGVFQPHQVDSFYLGWAGDGHIGRYNISHAMYWVLGRDDLNPLAGRAQSINAQMAAIELSYDRDWVRFRTSFFYASGDHNIDDSQATGFDTILDNPNFVGGQFSYWNRQQVPLLGVNLTQRLSLVPDLRSSKFQGQTNFVNPGLFITNFGFDFEVTQKLRFIQNNNCLWFDSTNVLKQFVFQGDIANHIGYDLSLGMEYRPFQSNNVIVLAGISTLIPGDGFKDIYNFFNNNVNTLIGSFVTTQLTY